MRNFQTDASGSDARRMRNFKKRFPWYAALRSGRSNGRTVGETSRGGDAAAIRMGRRSERSVDAEQRLQRAQAAQRAWAEQPVRQRVRFLGRFRQLLVERMQELVASVSVPQRSSPTETLAAEVLPLADAARFLQQEAPRVLRGQRLSRRGRPLWLTGVRLEKRREPLGVVLVLGPANYPLMLPGIQTLQAIVAGNAVLLKPGQGGTACARLFEQLIYAAGIEQNLLQLLPEDPRLTEDAIRVGVDKIVLTGSSVTGRKVMALAADSLTGSTMELSGCDAVYLCEDADVSLAAEAVAFGLRFNGSATCIAPRRVFVPASLSQPMQRELIQRVASLSPVTVPPAVVLQTRQLLQRAAQRGVQRLTGDIASDDSLIPIVLLQGPAMGEPVLMEDIFAPIVLLQEVPSIEQALAIDRLCPYALGASVFGRPSTARPLAERIDAGCVVINDMLVPTADPRVDFGGRRASGFGVTRGPEGLLQMTALKTVLERTGRRRPHFAPVGPEEGELFAGYLALMHGSGWGHRWRALWQMIRARAECRPEEKIEGRQVDE